MSQIIFTDQKDGGITAKKLNLAFAAVGTGTGSGDMTKAVYDTNANGVVDTCDSLVYTRLTGVPATFAPSAHASTHLDNGTDPIPVATIARTGSLPVLNGDASTFLTGSGTWGKPVSGETGNSYTYKWNTVTGAADPGSGRVSCNNAAPGSATAIYLDALDQSGVACIPANRLKTGDNVYLYPSGNFGQLIQYQLTGPSVNNGPNQWFTLPVTVVSNSGFAPSNNTSVQVQMPVTPATHALTHLDNGNDPIPVATIARTGSAPILSGVSTQYLNGSGTWTTPSGAGDMTKAVYDTNGNNVVDTCDQLAWGKLTGVPVTFAPAAHASTHLDNGADSIPVATTSRTGSLRILNGTATTFLDGTGNWSTPAPGGTVNPGTWTNLTYSTGWTLNTVAQYRVETNGSFQQLICQGIINYASGAASLAFTLPVGARPSVQRGCVLGGYDSSGDTQLFQASVSTAGAVNIVPMVRQNFSWPSATNGSVYLDNLSFAL